MNITTKLYLSTALNVILIVILGTVVFLNIRAIDKNFRVVTGDVTPAILLLNSMSEQFLEGAEEAYSYPILKDQEEKSEYEQKMRSFDEAKVQFDELVGIGTPEEVPEDVVFLRQIVAAKVGFMQVVETMFAHFEENPQAQISVVDAQAFEEQIDVMLPLLDDFIALEKKEMISAQEEALKAVSRAEATILYLVPFILLLALLVNMEIGRRITRPLLIITKAASAIVNGDYSVTADVKSNDEFEKLAFVFNETTKKLSEMPMSLEVKIKERTAELEKLKTSLEEKVTERTHSLHEKVEELEKMNRTMVNRELKMISLKQEIESLKKNSQASS